MKQKDFLVIGSNSFSGASFIKLLLDQNYSVVGVSRSIEPNKVFLPYIGIKKNKFLFYKIDINRNLDKLVDLIKKYKPVNIINFSAQGMVGESWKKPEDWYQTNLLSQVRLHNQLRSFDFISKYIHFTTPEVYGSTDGWVKESFNFNPSTPYAVSRAACDMHLMSFFKAYKFPVIFTRAANVYGPGQQLYRIIPRSLLFAITNKKLLLHGGGNSIRSFIHISDVSNALLKIVKKGTIGQTYHISTNEYISIKDLVKKICSITNLTFNNFTKIEKDRIGKDQAYLLDSSKIRTKLKWHDTISLDKGLIDTLNWVKNNINLLNKLPNEYKHKK